MKKVTYRTSLNIFVLFCCFNLFVYGAGLSSDNSFKARNGRVLTVFGNSGANVREVMVQPDGKIIAIGKATVINSFGDFAVVRYHSDGSMDSGFGVDGKVTANIGTQSSTPLGGVLQPDGRIVVVGEARGSNETGSDFGVMRFNTDGSLDNSFGTNGKVITAFTGNSIDYATSVGVQNDGKLVVVGISNGRFAAVRYNIGGSLDTTFGTGGKVTTAVGNLGDVAYAVLIQPDGKIVVAGSTTSSVASVTTYSFGVVRYNLDGSLDSTFGTAGKAVSAIGDYNTCADAILQADGKIILVGGASFNTPDALDFAAIRYNPDGSLDSSFGVNGKVSTSVTPNRDDAAISVAIQTDGKIILGGRTLIDGFYDDRDFALVRYNSDGSLDTSFGKSGKLNTPVATTDEFGDLVLQNDGKIIVGGSAAVANTTSRIGIVRYNNDGALDQNFGFELPGIVQSTIRGQIDEAYSVAVQPDGKIVSAGKSRLSNRSQFSLLRQNPDGKLDNTFGTNGTIITKIGNGDTDSEIRALALQPDGKIVAAGRIYDANNLNQSLYYFAVARYNSDGSLDTTFDGDGIKIIQASNEHNEAFAVALQPDGKIVIAGFNDVVSGNQSEYDVGVVRLNSDGSLDSTFGAGGTIITDLGSSTDTAYSLALQTDGKIVVGAATVSGFSNDFVVIRYNSNGSLDNSFGTGGIVTTPVGNSNDTLRSIAIQPDGKIIAGGTIRQSAAVSDFGLVRYNSNGTLDTSFGVNGKSITPIASNSLDFVSTVLLRASGQIILVGTSTIGSDSNLAISKYNSNGILDVNGGILVKDLSSSGFSGEIASAAAFQFSSKLIVVGSLSDRIATGRRDYLSARFSLDSSTKFDFDGDGKTDIGIFRPAPGEWWYLRSSDGGNRAFQFGSSTDKIVPGDYTGDGKTDVAFWRESTGEWFVLRSEDSSFYSFPFGASGDVPVAGDFDGDGRSDPAIFRSANATWYILRSSGGVTISQFGASGDVPVVEDYDGDGKADLAVFRPTVSEWWINKSSGGSVSFQFGASGDKPVPADFTGDGKADVAVWRPSSGQWFVLRSEDSSFYAAPFGTNGDVPVAGDYDGDGRADLAVFRPSSNVWYLQKSTSGFSAITFGAIGDKPIPSAFVP